MLDLVREIPVALFTSGVTWGGTLLGIRMRRHKDKQEESDRLTIHQDSLTFELLQNAREEVAVVRTEIETLRRENRSLREIEKHFYHYEQSLEHLEAILTASTVEERAVAERNARAFLNRMRRLKEARGTIANELQIMASEDALREKGVILPGSGVTSNVRPDEKLP